MILALDVHYRDNDAKIVGVLFHWEDKVPSQIIIEHLHPVEEYIPGQFYKRELPCLLKVIEKVDLENLETIIVDGYIYINDDLDYGLGGKLWESLNEQIPIIGVAKTSFAGNKKTVTEILRGESKIPLYISAIGADLKLSAKKVKEMHGKYRIPDILKKLDQLTKE